jgi:hypothetical protein
LNLLELSIFSSSLSSLRSSGELLIAGSSLTRFGEFVKLGCPVDDGFELVLEAHVVVVDELESMRSVPFSRVNAVFVLGLLVEDVFTSELFPVSSLLDASHSFIALVELRLHSSSSS